MWEEDMYREERKKKRLFRSVGRFPAEQVV